MSDKTVPATPSADDRFQAGASLGVSEWLLIDEKMNQTFAEVTRDPVAMEIDGQGYAHGFLTMSLLTDLMVNAARVDNSASFVDEGYLLNYGFNRLRLVEPIPLGGRIRGHFKVSESGTSERDGITFIPIEIRVEIENNERPALVGEWVGAWRK